MKNKYFLLLFLLFLLTGCSKNYYLVTSEHEVPIYTTETSDDEVAILASEKPFIIKGNKARRYTSFGKYRGYSLYNSSWKLLMKLNKKQVERLAFTNEKGYSFGTTYNYSDAKSTYSGGTVNVKGYTRKDGTYVKPHTRSVPKRH